MAGFRARGENERLMFGQESIKAVGNPHALVGGSGKVENVVVFQEAGDSLFHSLL